MLEKQTDEALMGKFQEGDLAAFELLLQRHKKGVFNFIFRFMGNHTAAEDGLQDVFLRLVAARASFECKSKFTTWLYTIARNLCFDYLRKKRHRGHRSLDAPVGSGDESEATLMDRMSSQDPLPDAQANDRALREHLHSAIAELSPEQREVFLMREEGGLPFEEIARIVQAPLNTIKSRMRYALQALRAKLEARGVGL